MPGFSQKKQNSNLLLTAANEYLAQRLSVIPVRGGDDPRTAKIAAVPWKAYTKRFATANELHYWFEIQQFDGIAIVCGRISRLAVLDFDDIDEYHKFAVQFPELLKTHIVESAVRHTPHIYLRIDSQTQGYSFTGGELRAEGQYVIAPPTQIGQQTYRAISDYPIHSITHDKFEQISKTLHTTPHTDTAAPNTPHHTPQQIYSMYAPMIGRNNALYRASRHAKAIHWAANDTITQLAPMHSAEQPASEHRTETGEQRHQEAIRTINSAYRAKTAKKGTTRGLPNTLREKLIETQKTSLTARLVDAVALEGWEASKTFTEREITAIGQKHNIGRATILSILQGSLSSINNRRTVPIVIEDNMLCRETAGVKKRRGRPPRLYQMPSIDYLCDILGVEHTGTDPVEAEDLRSGKNYRLALHRTLLERRPGEYSREWLAKRLGASVRSLQRYNRELKVHVTPVFGYMSFKNVDAVNLSTERKPVTPGQWLQDISAKRYPALQAIAQKLLKAHHEAVYVRRLPNHYALEAVAPVHKIIWRCLTCNARTGELPSMGHCSCQAAKQIKTIPVVEKFHIRECLMCGQMCFNGALVCASCTKKRGQAPPRVTFDAEGKPRFPVHFWREALTWDNVANVLPPEDDERPTLMWIEDASGKRYPPLHGLAYRLLKRFGSGNIYFVWKDLEAEVFYDLGRGFLRIGLQNLGVHFLKRAGLKV